MNALCAAAFNATSPARCFVAESPRHDARFRFACDLRDAIQREVFFMGRYEPQETALIEHFIKPGSVFVDVGANWGYFSLLAASRAGASGRVVAFEPDPRLVSILKRNIDLNGFNCVSAVQAAAADRTAELQLEGYDESNANHGVSKLNSGIILAEKNVFTVVARKVDDVLDEMGVDHVDLVKMDIEGAEDLALRGMDAGLKRGRFAALVLEIHPVQLAEKGRTVRDALDVLLVNGYSGWSVKHSFDDTRRAAYSQKLNVKDWLQQWSSETPLDSWPHMVWLAPGRSF